MFLVKRALGIHRIVKFAFFYAHVTGLVQILHKLPHFAKENLLHLIRTVCFQPMDLVATYRLHHLLLVEIADCRLMKIALLVLQQHVLTQLCHFCFGKKAIANGIVLHRQSGDDGFKNRLVVFARPHPFGHVFLHLPCHCVPPFSCIVLHALLPEMQLG